jgi:hypothetical protein
MINHDSENLIKAKKCLERSMRGYREHPKSNLRRLFIQILETKDKFQIIRI